MRRKVHTIIKMSLASILATLVAFALGVASPVTSGILAVLSVQLTRTDSFIYAGKRFADALIALAMATGIFLVLGYSVPVFFIFAILFIGVSFALRLEAGIVPALVLASRLLEGGEYSGSVLLNAFALMAIAITVALTLNIVYPLNTKSILFKWSKTIDDLVSEDLRLIATSLREEEGKTEIYERHKTLKQSLKRIIDDALKADKDILFDRQRVLTAYLRMRHAQMRRLDRIHELLNRMPGHHPYATTIGDYIDELSEDIGYQDKATPHSKRLQAMLEVFRNKPLPTTRQSFEIRATLYQILFEVEALLNDKLAFHEAYGTPQAVGK